MVKKIEIIKKLVTDKRLRNAFLLSKGFYDYMSDEEFLKKSFYIRMGKELNLESPSTFNEKLQWLKLYDRKPEYTTMVDKYEVKKYIADKIGGQYVIPTLGIWDRFEDIDFDSLPNQFVLKCTHDSGGLVICSDIAKLDIDEARMKITHSLKKNYYSLGREWPYKGVKPRIIAEKYMTDKNGEAPRDYKFFCFNGVVKCFKIDFDRFSYHRANYYDRDKNLLYFGEEVCPPDFARKLEIPETLSQMIEIAENLSKNIPFARIDLYDIDNQVYFGEVTLYPAAGFGPFVPEEWDYKFGEWISLPEKKGLHV